MRIPALSRMLAVFLAVLSLISTAAGALSLGKNERETARTSYDLDRLDESLVQARALRALLVKLCPTARTAIPLTMPNTAWI